jgi:hypothetical protein
MADAVKFQGFAVDQILQLELASDVKLGSL